MKKGVVIILSVDKKLYNLEENLSILKAHVTCFFYPIVEIMKFLFLLLQKLEKRGLIRLILNSPTQIKPEIK